MPIGVTWSNRMSIDWRTARRERWGFETPCGKLKHSVDLLTRDVELLDDLVDAGSSLEILEYR